MKPIKYPAVNGMTLFSPDRHTIHLLNSLKLERRVSIPAINFRKIRPIWPMNSSVGLTETNSKPYGPIIIPPIISADTHGR